MDDRVAGISQCQPASPEWGTGWGIWGYGFRWGTNPPTRTPTPTNPSYLPRGFPYP
jgi:hypothetical protein